VEILFYSFILLFTLNDSNVTFIPIWSFSIAEKCHWFSYKFRWLALLQKWCLLDGIIPLVLELFQGLRILSLDGSCIFNLWGAMASWVSRLPGLVPELQLLHLLQLEQGSLVSREVAERVAKVRPGLFVAHYDHMKRNSVFRRAVGVGGELRMEEFPATENSRMLLVDHRKNKGHLPSLRALREGQVVPENIAEFVTRPGVGYSPVQVQCRDLTSYFAAV